MTHLRDNIYFSLFEHRGKLRRRYKIKTTCAFCGRDLFADLANFRKSKRSFCNIQCKAKGMSGPGAPNWSGGRIGKRGKNRGHILRYSPAHPNARKGYVAEHRLVMESALGRLLSPKEFVHHIDCDPQNNTLDNLDVCSSFQHNAAHASIEKCVPELFKNSILGYNRKTKQYFVRDGVTSLRKKLEALEQAGGAQSEQHPQFHDLFS